LILLPLALDVKAVKITVDIPDTVLLQAKREAMSLGISLQQFVTEALKEKLANAGHGAERPWMAGFGKLQHLRKETAKINRRIEEAFEQVESEDRP
jgi:hypothetical protein